MAQTKLDLSDNKFEQLSTEILHLSGCTHVFGQFKLESGSTLSILPNVGAGKVLTSNSGGTATWQNIDVGENIGDRITKEICQTSHGFSVGDVLGWSGETYNKAIANGTYNGEVLGIVSKCFNANCFDLTQAGYVSGLTGLITNTTYFLSTSIPGLLTDINPTGNTEISKTILIATSSSTGWVLPYPGYVVTTGTTVGIVNACNGLSTDGVSVCLGGYLCQNTVIDCAYCLSFGSITRPLKEFRVYSSACTLICNTCDTTITIGSVFGTCCSMSNITPNGLLLYNTKLFGGSGDAKICLCSATLGLWSCGGICSNTLCITPTAMTITGTYSGFKGVQYADDYTTNFVNRSLVDKGYVDNKVFAGDIGWSNLALGSTIAGCDTCPSGTSTCQNTFYGVCAGQNITSGCGNIAVGYQALSCNITGYNNIAVGSGALYQNNAGYNIGIGIKALCSNNVGVSNIGVGYFALRYNTSGETNTAIGNYALQNNTVGCSNIGIGQSVLGTNVSGCRNIAIGHGAGYYETGSSKLYIANCCLCSLIYGEFDTKMVKIDGCMCITALPAKTTETCVVYIDSLGKLSTGLVSGGTSVALSEFTITGNSSSTGFTVNHAKNKQFVAVEIVRGSSPYDTVYTSISRPNANCVCITFDTAPASGQQYKILITS